MWCSELWRVGEGGGAEAMMLPATQASLCGPLTSWPGSAQPPTPRQSWGVCSEQCQGDRPAEQRVEAHGDGRQITCHFILATLATLPNHPERGELIVILRTSQSKENTEMKEPISPL